MLALAANLLATPGAAPAAAARAARTAARGLALPALRRRGGGGGGAGVCQAGAAVIACAAAVLSEVGSKKWGFDERQKSERFVTHLPTKYPPPPPLQDDARALAVDDGGIDALLACTLHEPAGLARAAALGVAALVEAAARAPPLPTPLLDAACAAMVALLDSDDASVRRAAARAVGAVAARAPAKPRARARAALALHARDAASLGVAAAAAAALRALTAGERGEG